LFNNRKSEFNYIDWKIINSFEELINTTNTTDQAAKKVYLFLVDKFNKLKSNKTEISGVSSSRISSNVITYELRQDVLIQEIFKNPEDFANFDSEIVLKSSKIEKSLATLNLSKVEEVKMTEGSKMGKYI
jgi:hypothetical protein